VLTSLGRRPPSVYFVHFFHSRFVVVVSLCFQHQYDIMRRRARRLTLAPGRIRQSLSNEEEEEDNVHRHRAEGRDALSRAVAFAVEGTRRPKPIHAVQDQVSPIKSKLWVEDGSKSDDSEDEDLSTPVFVKKATAEGFTLSQLCKAEKALASGISNTCSSDVRLARSIISKLVQTKTTGAPWKGPLPSPRISPPRTPITRDHLTISS